MTEPAEELYEGRCVGGPLDGQDAQSRFPEGFLLVDRPADECWVYDWTGSTFEVRDAEPTPVDRARRRKAAEEPRYDVLAAPWVGGE